MNYSVILLGIICLFSSCGGKKTYHALPIKKQHNENLLQQQIAKVDVPFPCQAVFVSNAQVFAEDTEQKRIKFLTQMPLATIIDFYRQNMEFLGWKEDVLVKDEEGLLSFQTFDRWCIISIRPQDKKTMLVAVFIGQKKESEQKS